MNRLPVPSIRVIIAAWLLAGLVTAGLAGWGLMVLLRQQDTLDQQGSATASLTHRVDVTEAELDDTQTDLAEAKAALRKANQRLVAVGEDPVLSVPGAVGPVGSPGASGAPGPQGEPGASVTGPPGEPGPQGEPGADGATGPQGEPGQPGADGQDGQSAYPFTVDLPMPGLFGGGFWRIDCPEPGACTGSIIGGETNG